MDATFVKNTYNQSQTTNDITITNINIRVSDKFVLKVFNRLAYNWEISGPFIVNSLLGLPKYYTLSYNVKLINIKLFSSCVYEFALNGYNQTRDEDNFVVL